MLVLFDIDGTLMVSASSGGRALGRACAALWGWDDALRGLALGGKTDPAIVDEIFLGKLGRAATTDEFAQLIAAYVPLLAFELATQPTRVRVLPGVDAAIVAAQARGALVGLATGNVEAGAKHKLERAGLWHRFAYGGFGSDARERARVVARGIERGRALAGRAVRDDEIWVVGDTEFDVAAAHACGARSVGVATGSASADDLRAAGAELVIDTLDELATHWR